MDKIRLLFGQYEIPASIDGVASYNTSAHISAEMMKGIVFDDNEIKIMSVHNEHNAEVTHESFFGENITRVVNAFKK